MKQEIKNRDGNIEKLTHFKTINNKNTISKPNEKRKTKKS